jgi:hypothetical protein
VSLSSIYFDVSKMEMMKGREQRWGKQLSHLGFLKGK